MNDHSTRDILDEATGALRHAPVPAGPPAELLAATAAAIDHRLAGAAPTGPSRRKRIMRYVGYTTATAAAVAVATVVGVLGFGGGSAAARVQKALDNAAKAQSVRLVNKLDRDGKLETIMTVYAQTDRSRWDINCTYPERNATIVVNARAKQSLSLDHKLKTARREALTGDRFDDAVKQHEVFFNPLGVARDIKDMTVKEFDSEKIDGRPMKVFMLSHPGNLEHAAMTGFLWIDEKTDLPARFKFIQYQQSIPGHQEGADLITDYEDWNKEFDPKLFTLDVPAGYKLIENDKKD